MADDIDSVIKKAKNLRVYYNWELCILGIAEPEWKDILIVKFVPFVRTLPRASDFSHSYGPSHEKLGYVELPMTMPRSLSWEEVGVV